MGWADVDALKDSITLEQAMKWIAYYKRFPFDLETLYFMPAASIAASVINANGGIKGKPVSVRDMLIVKPPPEKPVSMDEKWRRLFSKMQKSTKPA